MKHLYSAFLALLIVGSAGLVAAPSAQAQEYRYDSSCNCNRPVTSTRTVREAPRVVYNTRVVNTRKVVPRNRTVEENQLVVHVRPVIKKEIVLHRQHVHYQDIVTKRVNTINRFREEFQQGGTENKYQTTTSTSVSYRTVQGSNCNCGGYERVGDSGYREATYRY